MGAAFLIYFGYPQAHEDDVEHAVWAGLAVIEATAHLDAPEPWAYGWASAARSSSSAT